MLNLPWYIGYTTTGVVVPTMVAHGADTICCVGGGNENFLPLE